MKLKLYLIHKWVDLHTTIAITRQFFLNPVGEYWHLVHYGHYTRRGRLVRWIDSKVKLKTVWKEGYRCIDWKEYKKW